MNLVIKDVVFLSLLLTHLPPQAIERGDLEGDDGVRKWFEMRPDVKNYMDTRTGYVRKDIMVKRKNMTAINYAALYGKLNIVKFLL